MIASTPRASSQRASATVVALDQSAEVATGDRENFLDQFHGSGERLGLQGKRRRRTRLLLVAAGKIEQPPLGVRIGLFGKVPYRLGAVMKELLVHIQ